MLFHPFFMSIFLFMSSTLLAFTPKSFLLPSTIGSSAIFVDFKTAVYNLTYDVKNKKATYTVEIVFEQNETGKPVFDVVNQPKSIQLDGQFVMEHEVSTPGLETKIRIVNKEIGLGKHTLLIQGDIDNLVKFSSDGVSAAHWTSDLEDRSYLEAYLPTNLEYDQYAMTFNVEVTGTTKSHKIYANGNVQKSIGENKFKVTYPKYFTASSGFYHLTPSDTFKEFNFEYSSIDGRKIPVTIYGKENSPDFAQFPDSTKEVLKELEDDYGSFPHPQVVIYNSGRGGMEYCGATMTEYWALHHELTHSYFARGIVPAHGNSGWLDEAIASWRDNQYPRTQAMYGRSGMSSHPYYTRQTDRMAYTFGASFIAYLDGKISANVDHAGMKSFLRYARETYLFTPYTVEDFVSWMEAYYEYGFAHDFKLYTYLSTNSTPSSDPSTSTKKTWGTNNNLNFINAHPIHQKLSVQELESYL